MLTLPPPTAVLLDWDDFLVDSQSFYREAYHKTLTDLKERGIYSVNGVNPDYGQKGSRPIKAFMEEVFGEHTAAALEVHTGNKLSRSIYPHFKPGAAALLRYLAGNNIPHAIVSDSPQPLLEKNMEMACADYGITPPIFQGHTKDIPEKPDPTGVRLAMERLGVTCNERVLFMGDRPERDAEVARRAGITGIIVPNALYGNKGEHIALPNLASVLNTLMHSRRTRVWKPHEANIAGSWVQRLIHAHPDGLYSASEFHRRSLAVSAASIKQELLPQLREVAEQEVVSRMESIQKRARKNFAFYGLENAEQAGLAEQLTEALTDSRFNRVSLHPEEKHALYRNIKRLVETRDPLTMGMPMLPHKIPSPVKTRGKWPGMAEAMTLLTVWELTEIANRLYHAALPETSGTQMANFLLIGDSRRFRTSNHVPESDTVNYEKGLTWWIENLQLGDAIKLVDFESLMCNRLSPEQERERHVLYRDVLAIFEERIGRLLDASHTENSLKYAVTFLPFVDEKGSTHNFPEIFSSRLSCIQYDILEKVKDIPPFNEMEPAELYLTLLEHINTPYAKMEKEQYEQVGAALLQTPPTHTADTFSGRQQAMEYVRCEMVKEAYHATIAYITRIMADEMVTGQEAVSSCVDVRFSTRATKTTPSLDIAGKREPALPWHGEAEIHPHKRGGVTIDIVPALGAEAGNAHPITISIDTGLDPISPRVFDLLEKLAESGQPLAYTQEETPDAIHRIGSIRKR